MRLRHIRSGQGQCLLQMAFQHFTPAIRPVLLCQSFEQLPAQSGLFFPEGIQIAAERLKLRIFPAFCLLSAPLLCLSETAAALRSLLRRGLVGIYRCVDRSNQITVFPSVLLLPAAQQDLAPAALPHIEKRLAGLLILPDPEMQCTQTGRQHCPSALICLCLRNGRIFCIVHHFKLHDGAFCRTAVLHADDDLHRLYRRIPAQFIEHGHHALFSDPLLAFRQAVVKPASVYHHGTGRRIGEPSLVQDRQRFAGSGKLPFSVCPDLDPRVIVVTVGPFRRIDLPRRDSGAPHRVYGKRRLFPAPPAASLPDSQR